MEPPRFTKAHVDSANPGLGPTSNQMAALRDDKEGAAVIHTNLPVLYTAEGAASLRLSNGLARLGDAATVGGIDLKQALPWCLRMLVDERPLAVQDGDLRTSKRCLDAPIWRTESQGEADPDRLKSFLASSPSVRGPWRPSAPTKRRREARRGSPSRPWTRFSTRFSTFFNVFQLVFCFLKEKRTSLAASAQNVKGGSLPRPRAVWGQRPPESREATDR